MLTRLNPLACRYHSLIEFSVCRRVRSNINKIATASLQTRGSILTNSLWPKIDKLMTKSLTGVILPPRSQILNVISVLRMHIVFSIKLTPSIMEEGEAPLLRNHISLSYLEPATNLASGYSPHQMNPLHT